MVLQVQVYRNGRGEVFYRSSATAGRTASYSLEAEQPADLERWLRENGFEPVP